MTDNLSEQKIGKYIIIKRLGRGGMGYIYHARDPFIKRDVAIKIIHPDLAEDANLVERFRREAQSAGGLRHPNIVTIYDLGEDKGRPYIAMEYLEGTDLEQLIRNKTYLPLDKKLDIIIQVCEGLDYAHKHGIIHRDITPSNIRILENNLVKIMDFGIAKITSSQITQTGTLMGKPHYMAPEQIRGEKVDGRTDIFALGVCLYEFLTYRKPFSGENTTAVLLKIINDPPEPLIDANYEHPPELQNIILKALQKDPALRFQTAKEMAEALREFLPQTKITKHTVMLKETDQETILSTPVSKTNVEASEAPLTAQTGPKPPVDLNGLTINSHFGKPTTLETLSTEVPTKIAQTTAKTVFKTELITQKSKKTWAILAAAIIIVALIITLVSINLSKKTPVLTATKLTPNTNAPNASNEPSESSHNNITPPQSNNTNIEPSKSNKTVNQPENMENTQMEKTTQPSTEQLKPGFLKLNILPWAKISKITNISTNKIVYPSELYTPCFLELEPGNYSIIASNPELNKTDNVDFVINPGKITIINHKIYLLNDYSVNDLTEVQ